MGGAAFGATGRGSMGVAGGVLGNFEGMDCLGAGDDGDTDCALLERHFSTVSA